MKLASTTVNKATDSAMQLTLTSDRRRQKGLYTGPSHDPQRTYRDPALRLARGLRGQWGLFSSGFFVSLGGGRSNHLSVIVVTQQQQWGGGGKEANNPTHTQGSLVCWETCVYYIVFGSPPVEFGCNITCWPPEKVCDWTVASINFFPRDARAQQVFPQRPSCVSQTKPKKSCVGRSQQHTCDTQLRAFELFPPFFLKEIRFRSDGIFVEKRKHFLDGNFEKTIYTDSRYGFAFVSASRLT